MEKKLMLLAAMLAMALVTAPVIAQVDQGIGDQAGNGSYLPQSPVGDPITGDSGAPPPVGDQASSGSDLPQPPDANQKDEVSSPPQSATGNLVGEVGIPQPPPAADQAVEDDDPERPVKDQVVDLPQPPTGNQASDGDDLPQSSIEDQEADSNDAEQELKARVEEFKERVVGSEGSKEDEDKKDEGDKGNEEADGVEQEIDQETDETGDVDQSVGVVNTGDNVNQCVAVLQAANTGNAQNAQGFAQDASEADDLDAEGGGIAITPQLVQDCRQTILQFSTTILQILTGQHPGAAVNPAVAGLIRSVGTSDLLRPRTVGTAAVRLLAAGGPRAAVIKAADVPGRIARLPRTGGMDGASLLALGAGGLLIGGGLLIRKISS